MIDEEKAKEAVVKLNKENLDNLLRALSVEKYLALIFGNAVDAKYSTACSAMFIRYFDPRPQTKPNLIAALKTAMPERPVSVQHSGLAGENDRTRLMYPGGMSVVLAYERRV